MDYNTPVTDDEKTHHWYPTPRPFVEYVLKHRLPKSFAPNRVLDPGAGTGVWGSVARELWPNAEIVGVELREVAPNSAYDTWISDNYLNVEFEQPFDLVLGNYPFKLGERFAKHSLQYTREGGLNFILMPFNFIGTQKRGEWLWSGPHPIHKVHLSLKRISFKDGLTKTGKIKKNAVDQKEYCMIEWVKGYQGPSYITAFDWSR